MNPLDQAATADSSLGQRIRQARRALGWSLQDLASKLAVSKVSVWSWEHDRSRPRFPMMERLGKVLAIPLPTLMIGPASGETLSELTQYCRDRISDVLGISSDAVEITITLENPGGQVGPD